MVMARPRRGGRLNLIGANSTQAWCRTYRLAFSSGRKHSRYVRPAQPGMRRPRDRSDRYLQKTSAMPWSVDAVDSWRRPASASQRSKASARWRAKRRRRVALVHESV